MISKYNYILYQCDDIRTHAEKPIQWDVNILRSPDGRLQKISGVTSDEVNKRFEHGDLCFVVGDDQRYFGIAWCHAGKCFIRGAGKYLEIDEHDVYLYGAVTLPQMRRLHVNDSIRNAMCLHYMQRGAKKAYVLIDERNDKMKTYFAESGYRRREYIIYVKFSWIGLRVDYDYEKKRISLHMVREEPMNCESI